MTTETNSARVARAPINLFDLHWAAGFLEGEGSFGCFGRNRSPTVRAPQVQREPLERLHRIFGGTIYTLKGGKIYVWYCNGTLAVGLMMTLWTLMSPRRREQIEKGLADWRSRPLFRTLAPSRTGKCQRGHDWIPENIRVKKSGLRGCKICERMKQRAYWQRRKLARERSA